MDTDLPVSTIGPVAHPKFPTSGIIVSASSAYILVIIILLLVKRWCQSKGKTLSCPECPVIPACCECEVCTSESNACAQIVNSTGVGCSCADPPKSCTVCWLRYCLSFASCRCGEFHSCGCFYTAEGKFRCPYPTCPSENYPSCPSFPSLPDCPDLGTCCEPSEEEFQCPECELPSCPACNLPKCTLQCEMPECEEVTCLCCSFHLGGNSRRAGAEGARNAGQSARNAGQSVRNTGQSTHRGSIHRQ